MFQGAIHSNSTVRQTAASGAAAPDLGSLPEWRLDDLYSGMDSAVFAADLRRAAEEAKAFAERYRGKLEIMAKDAAAGEKLGLAVRAYEAIQDLVGRIMSYAGLVYAGDTSDPARAKFYGDAQEQVTALAGDLLFFELELNRLDDALIDAAMADPLRRPLPPVARGHPQGAPASALQRDRAIVSRKIGQRRRGVEPICSTRRSPRCASNSKARS